MKVTLAILLLSTILMSTNVESRARRAKLACKLNSRTRSLECGEKPAYHDELDDEIEPAYMDDINESPLDDADDNNLVDITPYISVRSGLAKPAPGLNLASMLKPLIPMIKTGWATAKTGLASAHKLATTMIEKLPLLGTPAVLVDLAKSGLPVFKKMEAVMDWVINDRLK